MKSKAQILQDIRVSAETGSVLKIKLNDLPNPIITAVERLDKDQILLKPTCLYGYELKKRAINLSDIRDLTRYKTNFNHPIFEKLRFIKNNISVIRHDFEAFNRQASPSETLTR